MFDLPDWWPIGTNQARMFQKGQSCIKGQPQTKYYFSQSRLKGNIRRGVAVVHCAIRSRNRKKLILSSTIQKKMFDWSFSAPASVFCRWLDSNPGSLVSEVTAPPTAPQPLPLLLLLLCVSIPVGAQKPHILQDRWDSTGKTTVKLQLDLKRESFSHILFQIVAQLPLEKTIYWHTNFAETYWYVIGLSKLVNYLKLFIKV